MRIPLETTPETLQRLIFENFDEALPFMLTHHMRLLSRGRDVMRRRRERIADICRDEERPRLVVQFVSLEQKRRRQLVSSLISEREARHDLVVSISMLSDSTSDIGQREQ